MNFAMDVLITKYFLPVKYLGHCVRLLWERRWGICCRFEFFISASNEYRCFADGQRPQTADVFSLKREAEKKGVKEEAGDAMVKPDAGRRAGELCLSYLDLFQYT